MNCILSKELKKIFLITALFSLIVVGSFNPAHAQKVERNTVTLGAQNQKSTYGGFLNLSTGAVYNLGDVNPHQASIDLIYVYGKTTKMGLLMPSSTGMKHFGKNYRDQVYEGWTTKNRGILIALENNKANRKLYKQIKTNEQLEEAYNNAYRTIENRSDYKKSDHGPAARLNRLHIGDFILIKSRDRKLYAIGRIVNHEEGYQGSITIDYKVTGRGK